MVQIGSNLDNLCVFAGFLLENKPINRKTPDAPVEGFQKVRKYYIIIKKNEISYFVSLFFTYICQNVRVNIVTES